MDAIHPLLVYVVILVGFVLTNLVLDVLYGWLDPRVHILGEDN